MLSGRGLGDGLITRPEESCGVCTCMCLSVIRSNNKPLHLEGVGRRTETNNERNEERNIATVNKLSVL